MKIYKSLLMTLIAAAPVFTACNDADSFDYHQTAVFMTGTETDPMVKFTVEDTPSTYSVTASATRPVENDVTVKFAIDPSKVDEYNQANSTSFEAMPLANATMEVSEASIPAGKALSSAASVRIVSTEGLDEGKTYVIPVTISSVNGQQVLEPCRTIFLRLARTFEFTALDLSDYNMYSNYIFPQAYELNNFTYQLKFFMPAWKSTTSGNNGISRLIGLTEADESRSVMLRFGEAGYAYNQLQVINPGGGFVSATHFAPGKWYNLAIVYDGSAIALYVDGSKDGEASWDGSVKFQRIELGMSWGGYRASQYFPGYISELRVWNRALTPAEMLNSPCAVGSDAKGLVGYWKLNEGQGSIFRDSSPNGLDMDWSKTSRDVSENGVMVDTPDAATHVRWNRGPANTCVQ